MKTTLEPSPTTAAMKEPGVTKRGASDRYHAAQIKIKTILVPLDFSRSSMEALNYAVELAKSFAATVHLLHVTAPDEAASAGAAHLLRQTADSLMSAREKLAKVHEDHFSSFWPANSHVRSGHPFHEICQQAREIDADLIVLATRGHSGLKRLLLGSTAERVLRFAPCPVLVVRRWKRGNLRVRRIMVPTDFSQCAMAGLIYGALWAKSFAAKLRLLYVLFPAAPVLIDRVATNLPAEQMGIPMDTQLEMAGLTKLELLNGVKCESQIKIGYPVDAICGETNNVDLVVISTHGRSGFKHALLGSVSEQVVRYAECPVLVVPSSCGAS